MPEPCSSRCNDKEVLKTMVTVRLRPATANQQTDLTERKHD